jgi:hypothetical protein
MKKIRDGALIFIENWTLRILMIKIMEIVKIIKFVLSRISNIDYPFQKQLTFIYPKTLPSTLLSRVETEKGQMEGEVHFALW